MAVEDLASLVTLLLGYGADRSGDQGGDDIFRVVFGELAYWQ